MSASIGFTRTTNWNGGFLGQVTITAAAAVEGWTLAFDAGFAIDSMWGAEIVSSGDGRFVIRGTPWNADIPAGGSLSFGFSASGPASGIDPSGFSLGGATLTPPLPTISVADVTLLEGGGFAVFDIELSAASASKVTVDYATADGTALAGLDFGAVSGSLTFAAGETRKQVLVSLLDDRIVEADETFTLTLANVRGATLGDETGAASILDDDAVRIAISDATMAEGKSGRTTMSFTVSLSKAATTGVTVDFATADGSATAGLDYTARLGKLTFAAGETQKTVAVSVLSDSLVEGEETILLRLANAANAIIADGEGHGVIVDTPPPRITISDATVVEGNSSRVSLQYTVSLSEAATSRVTVGFSTADGTATAGVDYTARTGTVTFAAGETQKTIAISVLGDRLVEMDETVKLLLSNPLRAVIADAEAVGTIVNNDLPRINIRDAATVTEGDPGAAGLTGVLSTRGGDIIDETGAAVKIAAVNWFGLETSTFAPHGLNVRNWKEMMQQMADTGFNAIRLPFSAQAVLDGGTPNDINWHLNPDLVGLSPLQIIDAIIDYAGEIGLRIILDHHRSSAGNGPNSNGLWYEGGYTMARWVEMWEDLAARYANNPTVIGADLSNEPHGASWNAWASAAEVAGNAIQAVNSDWLIIVEGVAQHDGQHYWWGGNLMGAEDRPVVLNEPGKLVYSAHDYPNSIWPQPFFQGPDFPENMPAVFEKMWGYLWEDGIAPVFIGEFGTRLEDPKDVAWLDKLVAYMGGDTDADGDKDVAGPGVSYAWWSWNPNSGDTGGILANDWTTVLTEKVEKLQSILPETAEPLRQAFFEVTLSGPVSREVTVGWRTAPSSATEADYIAASGLLTFAPGETSQTIAVTVRGDDLAERAESFRVQLFDVTGGVISDGSAIGRIADDDWVL
jgi:chitinase